MNAERLLQHFERISEAPDAVPRLRQLILDLAVRGKLVEQDPADEPAQELLKRIQRFKVQLERSGRESTPSPLPVADMPYEVPLGWVWVRFGSIIVCRDGERIPVSKEDRDRRSKIYDYYGASGVIDKIDGFLFDKPLLLIGEDGANLINRSTPIAFIAEGKYWVNNHAHVVDGISEEFLRYLELYINAIDLKPYVTGTAQPKMNQSKMNCIPIPLPPEAEQRRIVAKVGELMALCDDLEAARAKREACRDQLMKTTLHSLNNGEANSTKNGRPILDKGVRLFFSHLPRLISQPVHYKQLRQTILDLAVQGKLVEQDPADESTSELLETLLQAKARISREESVRKRKSVGCIGRSELGFNIPDSWELTSFDDVFMIASGVTLGKSYAGRSTREVPYLRVANVQRGYLDLSLVKTIAIPEDEVSRFQLRKGDILMTEGGDWDKLGRAAVWKDDLPECIHQNHVFRVRPALLDKLSSKWVVAYANSTLGRQYFQDASKKTTNLASINMTQLSGCPLPLPPSAEQHRIVAKIDELMALCDELEARLTETTSTQNRLLEALIHETLVG